MVPVRWRTKQTFVVAAALLAVATGGTAAALPAAGSTTAPRAAQLRPHPALRGLFEAAAGYLGLTPGQLLGQLRSGQSLAAVAGAQGKPVDGLKQAILAAAKARLDRRVTTNRITTTQEQTLLDRLQTRLDTLVNRTFAPRPLAVRHPRVALFRVAAGYLGLTPRQLLDQLRSGKSLADVIAAQGKSLDGLKQAVLDAARTRLDRAVTANRITSAQEQTRLDRLAARLDALLAGKLG
jgi:uncharacterized coiled-coil protein SlyX